MQGLGYVFFGLCIVFWVLVFGVGFGFSVLGFLFCVWFVLHMAPAAWISSRIAICNRTGNFPIPGEARHYLAAAAGGFGFAPKSV